MAARAERPHRGASVCRFCRAPLLHSFIDLGLQPLANAFRSVSDRTPETFYPLHAYVCSNCFLVQLENLHSPSELFGDYTYFSSYSESWLAHGFRLGNGP